MSTYQYDDYITIDAPAARLSRLRLHIREVSAILSKPDLAGDGKSVQYGTLLQYLTLLKDEEKTLMSAVGGGLINGGVSLSRNATPTRYS